jgi:hypothetical protein
MTYAIHVYLTNTTQRFPTYVEASAEFLRLQGLGLECAFISRSDDAGDTLERHSPDSQPSRTPAPAKPLR